MAILMKCKMCGGDLALTQNSTVATCEYCGTTQTVPTMDNEKKLVQFERAERLRRSCEFDKAAGVYESIVADFRQEAEGYWGLVLCKYGIEYVDDPATGKKIPTCHRSSFESVMDDPNFEQTLENADVVARKVYREEAKAIEEVRKGIIEVSGKEEPYDVFICYKETAEDGQRTVDSVLAQELYDELTQKGYRVFFSRITLEDKLGQEYEPYIFAALNSAKVMLAVGTDYEYYNAVWVKNEWRRYLKLMEKDKSKYLIPCFKGIDAYDMPKEFAHLQAQDMGKVGAMQDLLRGIDKLITAKSASTRTEGVQTDDVNRIYLYNSALEAMKSKKIRVVKEAVENLRSLGDWGDAGKHLPEAEARLKKLKRKRTIKRTVTAVILLSIIGAFLTVQYKFRLKKYDAGVSYFNENQYYDAWNELKYVGNFRGAKALTAEAAEKMCAWSDAVNALDNMFFGAYSPAFGELYFSLGSQHIATYKGESIITRADWDYSGFTGGLDYTDPADMARICENMSSDELLPWTDAGGSINYDPDTGLYTLTDENGQKYDLTVNETGICISGGETFGDGITLTKTRPDQCEVFWEIISGALGSGIERDDGLRLEGDGFELTMMKGKDRTDIIESGLMVIAPERDAVYISGGDPNWMLKLIPDGDFEAEMLEGFNVEVIGSGAPDVGGYYKMK